MLPFFMLAAYRVNCLKILLLLFCIKRGQEKSFSRSPEQSVCESQTNARSFRTFKKTSKLKLRTKNQTLVRFSTPDQASRSTTTEWTTNILWNLFEKIIKLMKWLMISISVSVFRGACFFLQNFYCDPIKIYMKNICRKNSTRDSFVFSVSVVFLPCWTFVWMKY